MRKWESVTGSSFVGRLDEVILSIGKDTFTRREMVEKLKCSNMTAAARLNEVVKRFKPKGARELSHRIGVDNLSRIYGVGVTTIYVWMCVLEYTGKDPLEWLDQSTKLPTICAKSKKLKKR